MRLWLPRYFRPAVSKWYLDVAERMSTRTKGRVHLLQDIRERQRQEAAQYSLAAVLPADSGLQFSSIYLVEIFPIEDLDPVSQGLAHLFPRLAEDPLDDFRENFVRDAVDFQTTFYRPIGRVVRTRQIHPGTAQTVVSDLPPLVEYIEVGASKILPSVIMILFEVGLTADATTRLREATSADVLSTVIFQNLLPWRVGFSRTSTNQTEDLRRSVMEWLADLRTSVENFIDPYLRGYFANNVRSQPRLPALEMFRLAGVDNDPVRFQAWTQSTYGWRHTIGLDFERDFFLSAEGVYTYAFGRWTALEPDKLVLFEDFWNTVPTDPQMAHVFDIARETFMRSINSLLDFVALRTYLEVSTTHIGRLRYELYKSMHGDLGLSRYISYHALLLERLTLLDRLKADFGEQGSWLRPKLVPFDDFIYGSLLLPEAKGPPLSGWLIETLEHTFKRNSELVRRLVQSYSDFIALQNMRVNYRLQVWVAVLTLVAVYATAIGVWGWDNAHSWYQESSLAQKSIVAVILASPMLLGAVSRYVVRVVSRWAHKAGEA